MICQYFYRARYYEPTAGRFISFDPILHPANGPPSKAGKCGSSSNRIFSALLYNPSNLNPFVYALDNPLSITDPSGESPWYGSYCGPGSTPGQPKDCYDQACKAHDECYAKCGLDASTRWNISNILSNCAWECDKKLATDWKNCACGSN